MFSSAALASVLTPLQVNITTPVTPHSVSTSYVSFNFDYHLNDEFGWINASVLSLNLSDPRLRTLASALAPAHLRIGGSQGDEVVYDVHGTECAQASTKWSNTTFCLTMARWDEINDFAASTGLTIAMGLNCMTGRDAKGDGFNLSNLADFLACACVCIGAGRCTLISRCGRGADEVITRCYAQHTVTNALPAPSTLLLQTRQRAVTLFSRSSLATRSRPRSPRTYTRPTCFGCARSLTRCGRRPRCAHCSWQTTKIPTPGTGVQYCL